MTTPMSKQCEKVGRDRFSLVNLLISVPVIKAILKQDDEI